MPQDDAVAVGANGLLELAEDIVDLRHLLPRPDGLAGFNQKPDYTAR